MATEMHIPNCNVCANRYCDGGVFKNRQGKRDMRPSFYCLGQVPPDDKWPMKEIVVGHESFGQAVIDIDRMFNGEINLLKAVK